MSESRKYGGCVLAATQSINQLYENFGKYAANTIFSQFATKFLFRTDDAESAKIIANIFGELEYSHQQKNTSYGAHEFRDGISYTEQQKNKAIITPDSLASLEDNQCFVGIPNPKIRLAKINVPIAKNITDKHQGFIESKTQSTNAMATFFNNKNNTSDTATNTLQNQRGKDLDQEDKALDNNIEIIK